MNFKPTPKREKPVEDAPAAPSIIAPGEEAKQAAAAKFHLFFDLKSKSNGSDRIKAVFPLDCKEQFDLIRKSTPGAWCQWNPFAAFQREDPEGKFWWVNKILAQALNPVFHEMFPEESFSPEKPPAITLEGATLSQIVAELRKRADKVEADATEEGLFPSSPLKEPAAAIANTVRQIAGLAKGLTFQLQQYKKHPTAGSAGTKDL